MATNAYPPSTPGAEITVPAEIWASLAPGDWLTHRKVAAAGISMGAVLSVVVASCCSDQSRSPRRWLRIVALVKIWLAVLIVVANVVFAAVPNLKNLGRQLRFWAGRDIDFGTDAGAHVQTIKLPSVAELKMPATVAWVYTPPGFDPSGAVKYPVVYLMHGSPGQSPDWFLLARVDATMEVLLNAGLIEPMIIVAPDVNGGLIKDVGCVDVLGGPQVETWLYRELLPLIEASYPTRTDRGGRAIGGMSSGGFCTLNHGLRHLETWGVMLAFEPYGDPGARAHRLLGRDRTRITDQSPNLYLPTMTFSAPIPTYMDVGSKSRIGEVRDLAQQLVDRGQKVLFRINAGHGHTWGEVRVGLPYALIFASREFHS